MVSEICVRRETDTLITVLSVHRFPARAGAGGVVR